MGPQVNADKHPEPHVIWTVRHGQRVDNIDQTWRNNAPRGAWDDPPLSLRGLQQATECGEFFAKQEVDIILSSPFTRCVQTAFAISNAFPQKIPIYIEPGICESLHVCQNPPGYQSLDELKEQFQQIDVNYEPIIKQLKPEKNEIECKDRLQEVLSELKKRYSGNILLVSHGAPIAMIHEILDGRWFYVGQCTVSKFTSTGSNRYTAKMRGDSSHLSDRSNLRERELQKPQL